MSALAEMKDWLDRQGVVYTEQEAGTTVRAGEGGGSLPGPTEGRELFIRADHGPKNVGYSMFFTTLVFDADGELVEWGSWE